jgi:hypothetical protein
MREAGALAKVGTMEQKRDGEMGTSGTRPSRTPSVSVHNHAIDLGLVAKTGGAT